MNPFILFISLLLPLPLLAVVASAVELEVGVRHAGLLVDLADRRKCCLDYQEGNGSVEDHGRTAVAALLGEVVAVFVHASFPLSSLKRR